MNSRLARFVPSSLTRATLTAGAPIISTRSRLAVRCLASAPQPSAAQSKEGTLSLNAVGEYLLGAGRSGLAATPQIPRNVFVLAQKIKNVGVVKLNNPKAMNSICDNMMKQLCAACQKFDEDKSVGAIIITGNEKVFSAGADVKWMAGKQAKDALCEQLAVHWEDMCKVRKPIIAAVHGVALGGGFELAMRCDMIVAADNSKFGLPELSVGTMPGSGGTQRLIRTVGKPLAMDMILTGRNLTAAEALQAGIISRVAPPAKVLEVAMKMAGKAASFSQPVVGLAKTAINSAQQLSLEDGLRYERHLFFLTFALKDRLEGMNAFLEKRKPNFKHE